jgi:uncharacterized membrane protein
VNYSLDKNPSLNGFWSQDIELNQNQNDRTEYIDGERYYFVDLKQLILFPQRSGELTVDPFEGTFVIRQQTQRRSRSLFDQFFGSYQDVDQKVKSNAVKIKVKPLPAGAPPSFKGAVGNFQLDVSLSKNAVTANEGIDLKVQVSGSGNLKLQEAPTVKLPADFEVYDPEINDKLSARPSGMSGSRAYQYLVIPRHKGDFRIDPIEFSYFDPSSGTYKTLRSEAFEVKVEKGEGDSQQQVYGNINKEDVKILGNDIRFIHLQPAILLSTDGSFYGSGLFYTLLALPFLLIIALFLVHRHYKNSQNDRVKLRSSRATKLAGKRLKLAKKYLDENAENAFYEELSKAMYGYVADKLNMQYAEISKENIKALLKNKGIDDTTIGELIGVLETCEMARFAPSHDGALAKQYTLATELIKTIENQIKS